MRQFESSLWVQLEPALHSTMSCSGMDLEGETELPDLGDGGADSTSDSISRNPFVIVVFESIKEDQL